MLSPPQIAMISPGLSSCEHSLNTLRYADRVKELGVEGGPEAHRAPNEDEEMAPSSDEEEHQLAAPPADVRMHSQCPAAPARSSTGSEQRSEMGPLPFRWWRVVFCYRFPVAPERAMMSRQSASSPWKRSRGKTAKACGEFGG